MHARVLALGRARYEYVSFIDDDNIIPPTWIQRVWESMRAHPDAGAIGGRSTARLSSPPPAWFPRYASQYAVGEQGTPGDVTELRGYLWGAGLTVRRSAWLQLRSAGFCSRLTGRRGRALLAGEDAELCLALRLAGWRLWYESTLQLAHAIEPRRLTWRHLRRMYRGGGASTAVFDPYRAILEDHASGADKWHVQARYILKRLMLQPSIAFNALAGNEGQHGALEFENAIGRLSALLRLRHDYDVSFDQITRLKAALDAQTVPAPPQLTRRLGKLPEPASIASDNDALHPL
jgi:cellulose synthase/poly-beta-1,6-N-acetylglucosamine synthase-like glycosyltransferase